MRKSPKFSPEVQERAVRIQGLNVGVDSLCHKMLLVKAGSSLPFPAPAVSAGNHIKRGPSSALLMTGILKKPGSHNPAMKQGFASLFRRRRRSSNLAQTKKPATQVPGFESIQQFTGKIPPEVSLGITAALLIGGIVGFVYYAFFQAVLAVSTGGG